MASHSNIKNLFGIVASVLLGSVAGAAVGAIARAANGDLNAAVLTGAAEGAIAGAVAGVISCHSTDERKRIGPALRFKTIMEISLGGLGGSLVGIASEAVVDPCLNLAPVAGPAALAGAITGRLVAALQLG